MKILHTGLFFQTLANMGMVHGHREMTREGQEKLYEAYARFELEFCRLDKYISPEERGMATGVRRIVPVVANGNGGR